MLSLFGNSYAFMLSREKRCLAALRAQITSPNNRTGLGAGCPARPARCTIANLVRNRFFRFGQTIAINSTAGQNTVPAALQLHL